MLFFCVSIFQEQGKKNILAARERQFFKTQDLLFNCLDEKLHKRKEVAGYILLALRRQWQKDKF